MPRKRDAKKPHPPTERVRMRAKNPQIGRRLPDDSPDSVTAMQPVTPAMPQAPVPSGDANAMDDDATEIADGPPPIPRHDIVVRKDMPSVATPRSVRDHSPTDRTPWERPPRDMPPPAVKRPPPTRKPAPVAASPRGRMGPSGTKAAAALAAQARVARLEGDLTPTTVPELKLVRVHMTPDAVRALDEALSGRNERRDLNSAGRSPKRALERLIHGDGFRALELPDQAQLLETIAADAHDVDTVNAAAQLIDTGVVGALPRDDRASMLELFRLLPPSGRSDLATFASRRLHGRSAAEDRDFEDTISVAHLRAIAGGTVAPPLEALGLELDAILTLIMSSLAQPSRMPLEDGADAVLGIFEFSLADSAPAELARLWRCLTLSDMCAPLPDEGTLDLGDYLRSQPGVRMDSGNTPLRLGLEQLAAFAHPRGGPRRAAFIMPGGGCVDADVTARAIGYLYGVGFGVAAGADGAIRELSNLSGESDRVPPAFVTVLHDAGERLFLFERLTNDRIELRSPNGGSTKPAGARRLDPLRQVEDPIRGIDSISIDVFEASVGVALIPRT